MRPRKRKRRPDWRRKKFVVNQEEILCWVEHYISLTCMHLHRGAICQHNEHLHNGFRDLYAAKRTNGSNSLWQYNSKFTIRPLGYMHLVDAFSWMIHTHTMQCNARQSMSVSLEAFVTVLFILPVWRQFLFCIRALGKTAAAAAAAVHVYIG